MQIDKFFFPFSLSLFQLLKMFYMVLNDAFTCVYFSQDGQVNALYSTPSIYTDAKNAENGSWPLKTDDYFP